MLQRSFPSMCALSNLLLVSGILTAFLHVAVLPANHCLLFLAHGKKCKDILTFGFNILLSLTRHGQLIRILLRTWIRIAASRLLLNIKSNSVAFRVYATRKMHPQSRKSPIKTKLLDRKIGGSTEICLDVPQVQKHQKDNLSCVHAEAKCRA